MGNVLSRRDFLKRTPAAAVAVATPTAMLAAPVLAAEAETPAAEISRLLRELLSKVKTREGGEWNLVHSENDGSISIVRAPPPPRIVEFAGPGWYEVECYGPTLPTEELHVEVCLKHPADKVEGRWFVARTNDPMQPRRHYQESWLRKILVRKIGGAV